MLSVAVSAVITAPKLSERAAMRAPVFSGGLEVRSSFKSLLVHRCLRSQKRIQTKVPAQLRRRALQV